MMVQPFPAAPQWVRQVMYLLKVSAEQVTAEERARLRGLDRPWDPSGCSALSRRQLWPWLDEVAGWINHEYGWQTSRAIPACWPRHPHLVQELAVLACLRVAAAESTGPQALAEWQRTELPGFLDRMAERLGQMGCQPGRHLDWPGRSRYTEYFGAEAVDQRSQLFEADTASAPRQGSTTRRAAPSPSPPPVSGTATRSPGRRRLTAVPDLDDREGVTKAPGGPHPFGGSGSSRV